MTKRGLIAPIVPRRARSANCPASGRARLKPRFAGAGVLKQNAPTAGVCGAGVSQAKHLVSCPNSLFVVSLNAGHLTRDGLTFARLSAWNRTRPRPRARPRPPPHARARDPSLCTSTNRDPLARHLDEHCRTMTGVPLAWSTSPERTVVCCGRGGGGGMCTCTGTSTSTWTCTATSLRARRSCRGLAKLLSDRH